MFYVYVLKLKGGKLYIGYTSNFRKRISDHTEGKATYTKNFRPIKLLYYEAYTAKSDATKRERSLKEYKSAYGQLKKRLQESLKST